MMAQYDVIILYFLNQIEIYKFPRISCYKTFVPASCTVYSIVVLSKRADPPLYKAQQSVCYSNTQLCDLKVEMESVVVGLESRINKRRKRGICHL
jgi:hypothetical protein